ncbi:MAG: biopolymer transporter ExbD [Bacteroidales bacterium]|nr:biopolymer transporter ExbD [Bacteroidales bacterium]MEE1079760.1 biopolymer transporter ExbD [Bacteroidales bacterium]
MSKFNKGEKRGMPELNTSSLPDLVFSILFFFMCITHMREDNPLVYVNTPRADQVVKLENKSLVTTVLVGRPKDKKYGVESRIQFNDDFLELENVVPKMTQARQSMKEADQPKMQVSLKIDKETKMGIVTELKTQLRKAQTLKISYSAKK